MLKKPVVYHFFQNEDHTEPKCLCIYTYSSKFNTANSRNIKTTADHTAATLAPGGGMLSAKAERRGGCSVSSSQLMGCIHSWTISHAPQKSSCRASGLIPRLKGLLLLWRASSSSISIVQSVLSCHCWNLFLNSVPSLLLNCFSWHILAIYPS